MKTFLSLIAVTLCLTLPARAQLGTNSGVLNPNQVGEEELAGLPHMTETLAGTLVEARPFMSMMDVNALLSKKPQ